jgi:hypothetical protein
MATTNLGRIGLVSRGTWSAGTYKNLDVVSYNNSLYICKVTTTTDAPTVTASWDLYVSDSGAAASATAAANSATAAAASYDSFDDRYLGAKTSDPTVDNDGNALLTGALYWNSATGVFKVWSGSAWVTNITSNQFGTNVATFLATPSSANLAAALTDKTGTGVAVFASNPTFPAQINLTANSGYNIYASGTADNYLAGKLGIGTSPTAGTGVFINQTTSAASAYGILNSQTASSATTSALTIFQSSLSTTTAAFTLNSIGHFDAYQGTIGAGSAVITQYGFFAGQTLTGATNNYGFYGGIAADAGKVRYNLFMEGTADNYLAGSLGIGTTSPQNGLSINAVGTTNPTIATLGTGSISLTSLPTAFGVTGRLFFGNSQSANNMFASIAGNYDAYNTGVGGSLLFNTSAGAGTAGITERMRIDSTGNVGIGTASPNASAILDVQSTTKGVRMPNMTTTQKNAIASPAAGLMVFDTTLAKLCVYSGAAWQTITSV